MKRTRWISCALFAAAALLVPGPPAFAGASRAAPAQTLTLQVRVRPVTPAGVKLPGYRVVHTFSAATCQPGSSQTQGTDRCFAGNAIIDPCWAEAAAQPQVLCLIEPWSHDLYRLHVQGGLSPTPVDGLQPIWGVKVAGGNECLEADGALTSVAGRYVTYYCAYGLVVLGHVNQTHRVWTVATARYSNYGYTLTGTRKVVTAWYARPSLFH